MNIYNQDPCSGRYITAGFTGVEITCKGDIWKEVKKLSTRVCAEENIDLVEAERLLKFLVARFDDAEGFIYCPDIPSIPILI